VGLTTISLNQFAQSVSKAEALCAEIASILSGLQDIATSLADMRTGYASNAEVEDKAGTTRL